ncbi:S9 family peptidase [Luteimonas sp. RD2P54]|uniref:S9 family peptidase n=1 Tax=Luteimonas endophytica TaxID=3042023 RepID=A0ABT6J7W2_9GAMM|nr:S9 family peptidase [Luteimonas endophytica]MDH5822667.1 S9 family peptidase [Luteimonas endophytica]
MRDERGAARMTGAPPPPQRRRLARWALPLLIACGSASAAAFDAADLVALRQVTGPRFDPAGHRLAWVVATPQPEGRPPRQRIWRRVLAAGAQPRELPAPAEASDHAPAWSPRGDALAFLSDRRRGEAAAVAGDAPPPTVQVWRVAADGDAAAALTAAPGGVTGFAWSPDGRRLAYLATEPEPPAARLRRERRDDPVEVHRAGRSARLWLQDPAEPGAAPRALTAPGLQVHDLAWSPDGRRLALRISDRPGLNDYWYRSRIVLVDAADGRHLRTLHPRASATPPQWSPDGRRLLYGVLGAHGMTAQAVVHDLDRDTRVALAPDWPGTLWRAQWDGRGGLVGQGLRGVRARFLRIDAQTGAWREFADAQAAAPEFDLAPDGRIAFVGMGDARPGDVWLLDGTARQALSDHNPQVAGWARGQLRELSWRSSRDGRQIHGVLVLPPGWRAGDGPLPTLVQIHGGPAWAWWSGWLGSWHEWAQLLAAHGYAVLLPNPRGSEGQGPEFARLARADWGGGDFQDVLDGLDLVVGEGIADPERVAIGGWSYGGYLAAWAVAHSGRFRTAIVGAGVTDIGAMALTTDTPDYLPGYFGDPLAARAVYDRHSPIRHAGRIGVPVLILHGEEDARVPLSQGEMLYGALRFNGTAVEMVRYPREPHWFREREHQRDVLERVLGWLDRHLAAAPAAPVERARD